MRLTLFSAYDWSPSLTHVPLQKSCSALYLMVVLAELTGRTIQFLSQFFSYGFSLFVDIPLGAVITSFTTEFWCEERPRRNLLATELGDFLQCFFIGSRATFLCSLISNTELDTVSYSIGCLPTSRSISCPTRKLGYLFVHFLRDCSRRWHCTVCRNTQALLCQQQMFAVSADPIAPTMRSISHWHDNGQ